MQYNTIQYNTIQYNTIQYNTIQYNTIQYNTIQYNTIQYNTIQYNTIQYNTIPSVSSTVYFLSRVSCLQIYFSSCFTFEPLHCVLFSTMTFSTNAVSSSSQFLYRCTFPLASLSPPFLVNLFLSHYSALRRCTLDLWSVSS